MLLENVMMSLPEGTRSDIIMSAMYRQCSGNLAKNLLAAIFMDEFFAEMPKDIATLLQAESASLWLLGGTGNQMNKCMCECTFH